MTKYTKHDVLEEAKKLAKMLATIEEIDRFKKVEAKLNENKKVQTLINKIKALQKSAVNFQHYGKTEALNRVEKEIDRIQNELDEIPVVAEFKETQVEINDILQGVSNLIANVVTDEIIKSTGGDVLKGHTKAAAGNESTCEH